MVHNQSLEINIYIYIKYKKCSYYLFRVIWRCGHEEDLQSERDRVFTWIECSKRWSLKEKTINHVRKWIVRATTHMSSLWKMGKGILFYQISIMGIWLEKYMVPLYKYFRRMGFFVRLFFYFFLWAYAVPCQRTWLDKKIIG